MTPDEIDIVEKRLKARCETFQKQPSEFVGYYGSHDAELDRDAANLIRSLSTRLREAEEALEREREECAKVAEETGRQLCSAQDGEPWIVVRVAAAIRARALSGLGKEK
jgi:hypothetical protein